MPLSWLGATCSRRSLWWVVPRVVDAMAARCLKEHRRSESLSKRGWPGFDPPWSSRYSAGAHVQRLRHGPHSLPATGAAAAGGGYTAGVSRGAAGRPPQAGCEHPPALQGAWRLREELESAGCLQGGRAGAHPARGCASAARRRGR